MGRVRLQAVSTTLLEPEPELAQLLGPPKTPFVGCQACVASEVPCNPGEKLVWLATIAGLSPPYRHYPALQTKPCRAWQ